jgi:molecular chaperone IbpA
MMYELSKPKQLKKYPDYDYGKIVEKPTDPFQQLNSFLSSWTVGFDRHFQLLEELRNTSKSTYPPYNIIQVDDEETYLIEIAAAGFTKSDIEITSQGNSLTVTGKKDTDSADYVHKGIAARNFEQKFALADDVKVISAQMKDGILTIRLEREIPEHKKPRTINIK